MPHLSKDNIAQFETELRSRRETVLAAIRQRLHHGDDPDQLALVNTYQDLREQAEADLLADTDLGQLQIELADLEAIDAALARLGAGNYGRCAKCGTTIALARLRAQPAARMCLACQEATEKYR